MNEKCRDKGIEIREAIMIAIVSYIKEHQYPPTVREIGAMVGLASTSSVHNHLQRLYKEGKIETDTSISAPRAIRVPGYSFVKEVKVVDGKRGTDAVPEAEKGSREPGKTD